MTNTPALLVLPLGLVIAMAPAAASAQSSGGPAPRRDVAVSAAPTTETNRRVVVTAVFAPAHSCAAVTCQVVTELDKGTIVSVLKTDGGWHQVLVRVGQTAMTTAWVQEKQVSSTSEPTARASSASAGSLRSGEAPAATSAPAPAGETDSRGCLTCVATREPTREEWSAALADAATKKARIENPPVATGLADSRTNEERMRDAFEARV